MLNISPSLRRGAQPANQNARTFGTFSRFRPGPLSSIRLSIQSPRQFINAQSLPPSQTIEAARAIQALLDHFIQASDFTNSSALHLSAQLAKLIARAYQSDVPDFRLSDALDKIALDPLLWIENSYREPLITRDADSFFPVSKKTTQNSPLPIYHPPLATNLTDAQWAVLMPLIPPDPLLDWLAGEPPVIIAANRWGFTRYGYSGEVNDRRIMDNYHQLLRRLPSLSNSFISQASANESSRLSPNPQDLERGPGRPPTSPRALLDAILWKLATGHTWDSLPTGFSPARVCQKYYRRLFTSGRWYTLLHALYNHFRFEASHDCGTLLENDLFTTTFAQKIALSPQAPPTWENYTALLFMQLARSAYSRLARLHKQAHPNDLIFPDFRGQDDLSTGRLPPSTSFAPFPF
ncbi:MAG TPA: transposase [Anaerolineaceae bacterium]